MSETHDRDVNNVSETMEKREVKLTAKALAIKIEKLQKERKVLVDKIKALIPAIKELMKRKENVHQVQQQIQTLIQLHDTAIELHKSLIPLLPESEQILQKEWFLSIESYTNVFKDNVTQWLSETTVNLDGNDFDGSNKDVPDSDMHASQAPAKAVSMQGDPQDCVNPSDSISDVGSRATARSSQRSSISSISSARINAEADLAALMARQGLLKDRHALEEEEEKRDSRWTRKSLHTWLK